MKGIEALKLAEGAGFGFHATASNPSHGSCTISGGSVVAVAGMNSPGITCEIVFFDQRKLQLDWKLRSATFAGSQFSYIDEPKWGSNMPKIGVRLAAPTGSSTVIRIKSIVLDGRDCGDVSQAFMGSTPY